MDKHPINKEMQEKNEMIAEFMGWTLKKGDPLLPNHYINEQNEMVGERYSQRLMFHTSWDWLMPCFVKAKNMLIAADDIVLIDRVEWLCNVLILANINEAYERLIKFITWYNQSK